MAYIDEKGNAGILSTVTNKWTEDIARAATMVCGGTLTIALFCMDDRTLKDFGVHGIVTRSEQLGRAIRCAKDEAAAAGMTPRAVLPQRHGRSQAVQGQDRRRAARNARGVQLRPCGPRGESATTAARAPTSSSKTRISAARWTATSWPPRPTSSAWWTPRRSRPSPPMRLKYGKRVMVVGLECFDMWRTPAGIDLVGPRYFGIDADYVPVEERVFAEGSVKLMYKLGIDVGGTNTDAVLIDEDLNIVAAVKNPRRMIYTAASWEPWRQF